MPRKDSRQEEPSVIRVAEIQRTIEDAIALAKLAWPKRGDGINRRWVEEPLAVRIWSLPAMVSGEISIDQFEILRQTYAPTDKELTSRHEVPQGSPAPTQAGTPTVPPAESSSTSGGEDGDARRRHLEDAVPMFAAELLRLLGRRAIQCGSLMLKRSTI